MHAQEFPGSWPWSRGRHDGPGFDRIQTAAAEDRGRWHHSRHGGYGRHGAPGAVPFGPDFPGPLPGPGFPSPGFGPGARGFFPGGRGRGAKVRRGDVRTALLALLAEAPMHGYQMINELAERSHGAWRPSPGSVYPVLQLLTDEELVRAEESDGKRVFHLTDAGRAYTDARADEPKPWDTAAAAADHGLTDLRSLAFGVGAAVVQVAQAGSDAQVQAAQKILVDARRALYRILAEDAPGEPDDSQED
ncbi:MULTISPECIES: PadR family transcriptional regulator [Protofrankia]|uniref:PadR family transcriptional regulator n=1 Tax=Protofrankia TaxID=2994361 RepID=UPI0010419912|nr:MULTISPECIES: PadR family transcriptional regulator [Protofrankia]